VRIHELAHHAGKVLRALTQKKEKAAWKGPMKMTREITLQVNGREEKVAVEDADTLLEVLRDRFKLWSVREGCGVGACGTCTYCLTAACEFLLLALPFVRGT